MKVNFEAATENEVPEIIEIMAEFNRMEGYSFDKAKTTGNLYHFIADQNFGRAWTIQLDALTIGYVILTFGFSFEYNGRDAFIDELFLRSAYRHKGIGKLAMDFIEKEASILGVNVVHLEVEHHNEGGLKLYIDKGYKNNGRILLSKKIIGS